MKSSASELTKELASLVIAHKSHIKRRPSDLSRDDLFDVIVCGSGIAGLSVASLLAQLGLHICLLEKNNKIGGFIGQV